ncbi:MAG: hypothetical protein ACTSVV_05695 [Promethearchaeota archaeon]
MSEKTKKSYLKFRDFLFGGVVKAESYTIFIDLLKEKIISKIIPEQLILQLNNKPINPTIFYEILKKHDYDISLTSSKNLQSLLLKLSFLDQFTILKTVVSKNESDQAKELIHNYILRSKNIISVKQIKNKFKDLHDAYRINDYLIELWLDDRITINGIDIPREHLVDKNYKDLSPEFVKKYKSIETYRVRQTGKLRAKIMLNDNYKVFPKGEQK